MASLQLASKMRIPYIIWSQCNTCSLKILISVQVLEWSDKCMHKRQCHQSNMTPSASNGPKYPAHGCCYLFRGTLGAAELQKNSEKLWKSLVCARLGSTFRLLATLCFLVLTVLQSFYDTTLQLKKRLLRLRKSCCKLLQESIIAANKEKRCN